MAQGAPNPGVGSEGKRGPLIGYVAHVKEELTYRGAIVLVSLEGDPADFIYTEPVTINRFMQRLLGPRMEGYVATRVLLEPLLGHMDGSASLVFFDHPAVLQRRLSLEVPAVVLAPADAPHKQGIWISEKLDGSGEDPLTCWVSPEHRTAAVALLREAAAGMAPFSLREPFRQLRSAMAELRGEKPS